MEDNRLGLGFFNKPPRQLARSLLGKTLARSLEGEIMRGIIVEVEAYLSNGDPASHSHRGLGKKNRSMFLPAGTLYVYPIHTRHCLNVVTEPAGRGSAVLIRAIEPFEGQQLMAKNRFGAASNLREMRVTSLTQGPGRLCQALSVDRRLDGVDLTSNSDIWLEDGPEFYRKMNWKICRTPRIGISQAAELPLRMLVDGNQFVSGCARDHSHGRTWTFEQRLN